MLSHTKVSPLWLEYIVRVAVSVGVGVDDCWDANAKRAATSR